MSERAPHDCGATGGCPLTPSPSPARGEGRKIARECLFSFPLFLSSPLSPCGRGVGGEGRLANGAPRSRTVISAGSHHGNSTRSFDATTATIFAGWLLFEQRSGRPPAVACV